MNVNWSRWILASTAQHFSDALSGHRTMFVEGQHRETSQLSDFVELRIMGPDFWQISPTVYNVEAVINVLAQSKMDDANYHRLYETYGYIQMAFTAIDILELGTSDSGNYVGCMTLADPLITRSLGQLGAKTNIVQGYVQGTYNMRLE